MVSHAINILIEGEAVTMRRAAIVSPLRTAVGGFGGTLKTLKMENLGTIVLQALAERTGVDLARIDDVIFGHAYGSGEAPALGRWCALNAGWPISVGGMEMERRCGSGLMAITTAAMMVQTGAADVKRAAFSFTIASIAVGSDRNPNIASA
jgi:acetyl-CoA C-acetyltransferase